jgi:hypothetical protein
VWGGVATPGGNMGRNFRGSCSLLQVGVPHRHEMVRWRCMVGGRQETAQSSPVGICGVTSRP